MRHLCRFSSFPDRHEVIPALPPESGRLPNPHLGVDGAGKGEGRCLRYIMTGVQNGFDRARVGGIRLIAPAS